MLKLGGQIHRLAATVLTLLENKLELRVAIKPILEGRNIMRRQCVVVERLLSQIARNDESCRRLAED